MAYTDPGLMDRQIDFWDQPSEPNPDGTKQDPVLFVAGIWAHIVGIWSSTTQAKKLAQQVISDLSHEIVLAYLPGLRTRMFIVYNDPDIPVDPSKQDWEQGRRFDIDRIVDPDEHKVELQILAIERNDGQ